MSGFCSIFALNKTFQIERMKVIQRRQGSNHNEYFIHVQIYLSKYP